MPFILRSMYGISVNLSMRQARRALHGVSDEHGPILNTTRMATKDC